MFSIGAAPGTASRAFRVRRRVIHASIVAAAGLGMLAVTGRAVEAQTAPPKRLGLIVPTGMVVPTGAQRDAIKRANLTAVQLSYRVRSAVAITGMVGWARSRDVASTDQPKLDVFTYDVGVEVRGPRTGEAVSFTPFAGMGAGARSYNYRSLPVNATHNLAAYGGVGGELRKGRLGLRLEGRDYVTGFKPLDGRGPSAARNDLVVMAGLSFSRR